MEGAQCKAAYTDQIAGIMAPGAITALFQPIINVGPQGPSLHALECLSRGPKGTPLQDATDLFNLVREAGASAVVDLACIRNSLVAASALPGEPLLTVNVHASTLFGRDDFALALTEIAAESSIRTSRLIVEIIEHTPNGDTPVTDIIDQLRRLGIQLAVDDIGAGRSNLLRLVECHPDYFKVDRHLISNLHTDLYRQAILESVCTLARKTNSRVVAEGVETLRELNSVTALGIDLVQGNLISPPVPGTQLQERGFLSDDLVSAPVAIAQALESDGFLIGGSQ